MCAVRSAPPAAPKFLSSQCLVETGVVGLHPGGARPLAWVLTAIGLFAARTLLPKEFAALTHLDVVDIVIVLLLALASTVLAGPVSHMVPRTCS